MTAESNRVTKSRMTATLNRNTIMPFIRRALHRLRLLVRLAALGLGLGMAGAVNGAEREPLTWAIYDLAPSYLISPNPTPDNLGNGIADSLLKIMIKSMPEYQHKVSVMTMPRVLAEMEAGKHLCVANVRLTSERARVAFYTPLIMTPSPQLVLHTRVLARHPDWAHGVSLAQIVQDTSLHGQFQALRSFGDNIDAILRADTNLNMKSNSGATATNAMRMVEIGRIDYTLEYPMLVYLYRGQYGDSGNLRVLPLLEGEPFTEGYVMCTRNAWGEKVMRRIDKELQNNAASADYQSALARWLPCRPAAQRGTAARGKLHRGIR